MTTKSFFTIALTLWSALSSAGDLPSQFVHPPAAARPWVYWFWNNGNVTKAGITADLEAMQRAGIGGVIIMDVVERFAPPAGPADFMNAEWQELFRFAVAEAHRLGLEINMTNGPGWCGSSGPWITPALSMQMLVATNLQVEGPASLSLTLPQPDTEVNREQDGFNSTVKFASFYRDIAVLAVPRNDSGGAMPEAVVDVTDQLDAAGHLHWDVPAGSWTLMRIGHTSTGSSTRPPVKGGNGLECDKLSAVAMEVHFTNLMGKLIASAGPMAGPTLSATHIDSWEVGTQNWTPGFREEFRIRRGYDLLPFLPNLLLAKSPATHRPTVGDAATVRRFRWDFQQTVAELLAENYVGRLADLAHQHGLRLTMEGYNLPFGDEATYTQRADEPMSEFWATGGNENESKGRQMASVAHVMGQKVVGAEAFTAGDNEQWKMHPATVKALGDYQFCQGINRFVIHRYAHQPYLDRVPGATMGPWGLHYERTQTWWEMSGAWHEYLSRCQFLLRQGVFVADLLYLRPELPDQTYFRPDPPPPVGYKYDEISAEALLRRVEVKDGRLILPDGMSYRLLVLPAKSRLMTPALAAKIQQLVADGAVVLGPPPQASPSWSDFPNCDRVVAATAAVVWGDCDGKAVTEHACGKGRVYWGRSPENILTAMHTGPDFSANLKLNWIHRQADGAEIYFVANERPVPVEAECHFRTTGGQAELWDPLSGDIAPVAWYEETATGTSVPLRLEGSGSVFVVFRPPAPRVAPIVRFTRNSESVRTLAKPPVIHIQSATYGVPGDSVRTRDVRTRIQALVDQGDLEFAVRALAEGDDPALGVVKTLVLQYTADGHAFSVSARDPDQVNLDNSVLFATGTEGVRGLTGEYFSNVDLRGTPALVRTEPGINFSWERGSPAPEIPATNWSARWTGHLSVPTSGEYSFCMYADDGCRLFIADERIIDHWSLDGGSEHHVGKIRLTAGQKYPVRIEYFQGPGNAGIHLSWQCPVPERPANVGRRASGSLELVASQPGRYELTDARGKSRSITIKSVLPPQEIGGPWRLQFPAGWGAPDSTTLGALTSLSTLTDEGVKYFSGTMTYATTFDAAAALTKSSDQRVVLDLGDVAVMAQVVLNGHELGTLWRAPFTVDVTGRLKRRQNQLQIRVANLWPNRMIGDAALPAAKRFTWSSYEPFTKDSALPPSGLLGPVQLRSYQSVRLPKAL